MIPVFTALMFILAVQNSDARKERSECATYQIQYKAAIKEGSKASKAKARRILEHAKTLNCQWALNHNYK